MGRSRKSIFIPKNPKKYVGNASNIICRSSWERVFCERCDTNDNIVTWASEEFSIPYVSPLDNKRHRYYPDFLIKVKEPDGKFKKYVIEIKPRKQTAVNVAKWNAAIEFCKDNSLEFQIITEDNLYGNSQ